jgi:hypothetical protein
MKRIEYHSQEIYTFAVQILQHPNGNAFGAKFHPNELVIEVDQVAIAKLQQRLADGDATILPYLTPQKHHWIIVGQNRRSLDAVLSIVQSFLSPTYCNFQGSTSVPQVKQFDIAGNDLQRAGSALYKSGYYSIESPPRFLTQILDRLELWLDLETRRPTALLRKNRTYRDLFEQFNKSIDQSDWGAAEICLREIQKLNLSTADNLHFLRIQLLAAQDHWQDIWEHPNFEVLAKLKMPRSVRGALLSAAYFVILEPLEQKELWKEAAQEFQQIRPKLGLLLTGRFGLTKEPILKVFSYQALVSNDRVALEELQHISQDTNTHRTIVELKRLLSIQSVPASPNTIKRQIFNALDDANFDAVLQIIEQIPNEFDRVFLFLETAFFSGDLDGEIAKKALNSYQELPDALRQELQELHPQVLHYINALDLEIHSGFMRASWLSQIALLRESTWRLICEFEIQFRRLIEIRYQKRFGDSWTNQINLEWREKWALARQKDDRAFEKYGLTPQPVLNYSYLGELMVMVNNEWSLFEDIFGSRKLNRPLFTQKLEAIIKVRNPLAHNRTIPENELRTAEKNTREFLITLHNISIFV